MQPDPHQRVRPRNSVKCDRTTQVSGSTPAQAGPNLRKREVKNLTALLIPVASAVTRCKSAGAIRASS